MAAQRGRRAPPARPAGREGGSGGEHDAAGASARPSAGGEPRVVARAPASAERSRGEAGEVEQEVALLQKTTAELARERRARGDEAPAGEGRRRGRCVEPALPPTPAPSHRTPHLLHSTSLTSRSPSPRHTHRSSSRTLTSRSPTRRSSSPKAALLEAANDAKRNAMESANAKEDNLKLQARVAAGGGDHQGQRSSPSWGDRRAPGRLRQGGGDRAAQAAPPSSRARDLRARRRRDAREARRGDRREGRRTRAARSEEPARRGAGTAPLEPAGDPVAQQGAQRRAVEPPPATGARVAHGGLRRRRR